MTSTSNRSLGSICPLRYFSTFLRKNYTTYCRKVFTVRIEEISEHTVSVLSFSCRAFPGVTKQSEDIHDITLNPDNCVTALLIYIYRVFSVCHEGWGKQGRGGAVAPLIGAGPRGAGSRDCQCPGPRDRGNQVWNHQFKSIFTTHQCCDFIRIQIWIWIRHALKRSTS